MAVSSWSSNLDASANPGIELNRRAAVQLRKPLAVAVKVCGECPPWAPGPAAAWGRPALGTTVPKSSSTAHRCTRVGRLGGRIAPHALRLGVGLDQVSTVSWATAEAQVVEGLVVDREEAASGAVLRRHVGDGGPVGQGQGSKPSPKNSTNLPTTPCSTQHLHHAQHEVGGGDAFRQAPVSLKPTTSGSEHGDRLAEHGGLRLDAAHAPAEHAEAVDHGGVAVGADQGVGVGQRAAVLGHGSKRLGPNAPG